ncbi:hypothetical protein TNCV_4609841 [Trichonephila clavipes]|nr:hypothetical protein TNCV_4609841 [Trichonephila clavipes]
MGTTKHHRTWGLRPYLVRVTCKNSYEGCDVAREIKKGNKRIANRVLAHRSLTTNSIRVSRLLSMKFGQLQYIQYGSEERFTFQFPNDVQRPCTVRSSAQWPVLPAETLGELGNLHKCRFLQPHRGAPNPFIRLANSPRLAHCPPNGYNYRDFHRLNVAYDPMFYGDISSPCCLLLPL